VGRAKRAHLQHRACGAIVGMAQARLCPPCASVIARPGSAGAIQSRERSLFHRERRSTRVQAHPGCIAPNSSILHMGPENLSRAICPQARPATFHFLVCCREQHSSRVLQFVPMQNWSEQTGHPRRQAGKRTPPNDSSSILPFRLNRALISDEAYHTALRRSASRCKCVRAGCIPDTLQPISPSPAQGVRTAPLLTTGACVDT
jgi:hypothetical protein